MQDRVDVFRRVERQYLRDRLGDKKKALAYHRQAQALKPQDPSVKANELYFSSLGLEISSEI